jgi:macrolide transport system ATP-binding/permease protein
MKQVPMWRRYDRLHGHDCARDVEDELRFHIEAKVEELIGRGWGTEAARREAQLQLGDLRDLQRVGEQIGRRMELRSMLKEHWEKLRQDVHFALRQLARDPGMTCTATFILALGIAASVAIFAFVDAALLEPLPYDHPNQLMDVTESLALFPRGNLSYPDYVDWKGMNRSFTSLDVYVGDSFLLAMPQGAEPVRGVRVSAGFFRTLGIGPAEGRDFRPDEDSLSAAPVGLLSYAGWQKRFGGSHDAIGKTVKLSGVSTTIIGVLPASFQFAPRGNAEFFVSLQPTGSCAKRRSCHDLMGIGRLKDGVTVAAASSEMKAIALALEHQYPDSNRGQGASVMPLAEAITGDIRPVLLVLLSGAGLLLLIACVNVTNLLLVRAEKRRREMAVRGALGASRSRLLRQYVTESCVLVAAGIVLGLSLTEGTMHLLLGLIAKDMLADMPYLDHIGFSLHVQMFVAGIAGLAVFFFSLAPILRLPVAELRDGLNDGGRGSASRIWQRLGKNLVITEVAVAVVLLSGAGLLTKSFWRMLRTDLGFDSSNLATLQIGLPDASFPKEAQRAEFARSVLDITRGLPGVQSASVTTLLPVTCNCDTDWVRFVGKPYNGIHNEVNGRQVSPGFFHTIRARLLRGRFFDETDDANHPKVVIINETLARTYFPGEDPIGKQMGDTKLSPGSLRRIVGVVADIKDGALNSEVWPTEYESFPQDPSTDFSLVVRTSQRPESILPEMSAAIRRLNPQVGVENETTMDMRIQNSYAAWLHRMAAWLVGGFAAIAFLLSMIGLYGIIAYSVGQRTREIGVRIALGAQQESVCRMILHEAAQLVVIGTILGLAGAIASAHLMRELLFEVRAWDLQTLTGVAIGLTGAGLLASYLPARRAARVSPVEALRAE